MSNHLGFHPAGNSIVTRKGLERVADIDPRLTRSHYFDSRLLTAEDLNRDQIYLDGRLREVGRALGYGVMRGLELTFDPLSGDITVAPGVAITPAGRVLELGKALILDLNDKATISELNNGLYRRFNRALYAVILKYAEIGTDIAEVFPRDLGTTKEVQFDVISEGVQLAMVPLPFPLLQQNPLHIRAHLMQQLYRDSSAGGVVSDDAVGLGIVAIDQDRPQWLDSELLRQPLRSATSVEGWQADLHRRYEKLFDDVLAARAAASLSGDFAAADYFRWLPPVGSVPKASIDPVNGRQGYFPERYRVSIAPVRKAELNLLLKESMVLPPLDLGLEEAIDLVVLAPLNSADYVNLATRLAKPLAGSGTSDPTSLSGIDLLRLRLRPQQPVHELDLDRNTWQAIWDLVEEQDLVFVRRPLRTAETHLSGIVLQVPPEAEPAPGPAPSPADTNLLADEGALFLTRLNVRSIAALRGDESSVEVIDDLNEEFGGDADAVQHMLHVALRVERRYDALLWRSLLAAARTAPLADFSQRLRDAQTEGEMSTPEAMLSIGGDFGFDATLLTAWAEAGD